MKKLAVILLAVFVCSSLSFSAVVKKESKTTEKQTVQKKKPVVMPKVTVQVQSTKEGKTKKSWFSKKQEKTKKTK